MNGSASAIELNPSSGSHTLSVAYSGDTNFRASTSTNVLQAVNAMPDFTVGIAGNSQQTVIAGSSATFGLTVGIAGSTIHRRGHAQCEWFACRCNCQLLAAGGGALARRRLQSR